MAETAAAAAAPFNSVRRSTVFVIADLHFRAIKQDSDASLRFDQFAAQVRARVNGAQM
jgi:hypothetical protein